MRASDHPGGYYGPRRYNIFSPTTYTPSGSKWAPSYVEYVRSLSPRAWRREADYLARMEGFSHGYPSRDYEYENLRLSILNPLNTLHTNRRGQYKLRY